MNYESVIGLEVHAQMTTRTKIFCGCSTEFGKGPNSQTCPICIGMPGVLPVLNERALEIAVTTGIAMNCEISRMSRFARKNYFYPDLPKGYQISQYELPICGKGWIDITTSAGERRIGITRIHMEEDAGKNIHAPGGSLVDLNRTGVPLMEIVSEPDMRTSEEAGAYMRKLRTILRYIGACDGNMEQGSLRCDANVSVRPEGSDKLGVKVEIKNINSFRFVEKAIEYEIKRQIKTLKEGGSIAQETRLFDSDAGATHSMRSKEEAHDYRYFPDPDLVPISVSDEWIDRMRSRLPELPDAKRARFIEKLGLSEQDADNLISERATAEWFEEAVKAGAEPKAVANWMMGELTRRLNDEGVSIDACLLKPAMLAGMIKLIASGTISGKIAKTVFDEMYKTGKDADAIVKEKGLVQISDAGEIEKIVDSILASNPSEVERFRAGDEKLLGFFVGLLMRESKGKANPKTANELFLKKLKG